MLGLYLTTLGIVVLPAKDGIDSGRYIGTEKAFYDGFEYEEDDEKEDNDYIYTLGRYINDISLDGTKVDLKWEFTLYNLTKVKHSENYNLNVRGLDVTAFLEPTYSFFLKPYFKYGIGLSVQEYIDTSTNTSTKPTGLQSGFFNSAVGIGINADFYEILEVYSEYEYRFYSLDEKYEDMFLDEIHGVKFGARLKF